MLGGGGGGGVDSVKPLCIAAGIVINLQLIVSADVELVSYFADGHTLDGLFLHLKIFARQLKALGPRGISPGTQFLSFSPRLDAHVLTFAAGDFVVDDVGLTRHGGMLIRDVRHLHLVRIVGVVEEIIDSFFLHQAADEVEIGFAVLDTIIALVVGGLDFVVDFMSFMNLVNDLRHGEMLENSAANFFGEQPNLGDNLRAIPDKPLFAWALAEARDQPVEVALLPVELMHLDGHGLTENLLETHIGWHFGEEVQLEVEKLGDGLLASQAGDEQKIFAQRGSN